MSYGNSAPVTQIFAYLNDLEFGSGFIFFDLVNFYKETPQKENLYSHAKSIISLFSCTDLKQNSCIFTTRLLSHLPHIFCVSFHSAGANSWYFLLHLVLPTVFLPSQHWKSSTEKKLSAALLFSLHDNLSRCWLIHLYHSHTHLYTCVL